MRIIDIDHVIPAPIEKAFAFMTEVENYLAMPGVLRAELLTPGHPTPPGAGAIREVVLPGLKLIEHIEVYRPPTFMRYRIIRSLPPLRHEHGFMAFTEVPDGTRVRWFTEYEVAAPLSGPLTLVADPVIRAGFRLLLHTADRELSGADDDR